MTPETQRIAIAEAYGYKPPFHRSMDRIKIGCKTFQGTMVCDLPDYLNDLNACHEAEKVLTREQKIRYLNILANVCDTGASDNHVFATAAQRAEAFLRTLGLWKP